MSTPFLSSNETRRTPPGPVDPAILRTAWYRALVQAKEHESRGEIYQDFKVFPLVVEIVGDLATTDFVRDSYVRLRLLAAVFQDQRSLRWTEPDGSPGERLCEAAATVPMPLGDSLDELRDRLFRLVEGVSRGGAYSP